METQQIRQIVVQELPFILQQNREVQQVILRITRGRFADQVETESRFDRLLDELRRNREEESKKWEEQGAQWTEQDRKWHENQAEINRTLDNLEKQREEQAIQWAANRAETNRMLEAIEDLARKHDATIGALGARWGLYTEEAFRTAMKGILEESFPVQVLNVVEFDDEGEVFGRPDQVELDLVIRDGLLIICELKSSMSRGDVYLFDRKASFYERKHNCTASRKIVISPMVDKRARAVADTLGVQVYSYPDTVDSAIFAT